MLPKKTNHNTTKSNVSEADLNLYVKETLRNNDLVKKSVRILKPYAHALLKAFRGQKCGKNNNYCNQVCLCVRINRGDF